jgi:Rad3-related DNA helicase
MNDETHHILDWLRDAHAIEQQSESMLQSQVKRLQNYPELKANENFLTLQEELTGTELPRPCLTRRVTYVASSLPAFGSVASSAISSTSFHDTRNRVRCGPSR